MSKPPTPRHWLARAEWRGTALRFYVTARNESDALRKAENQVKRMQGCLTCMGVRIVQEVP